ncbi:hypothetical protein [Serratia sp. CY76391]|uniref:hypothetical protein n=1 Tax=Serratia sp. CY76391 TaxID=3383681 RepID=UPI003F9F8A14
MTITYATINQQYRELEAKRSERKIKLQRDVSDLVGYYRDSLQLPGSHWVDAAGREQGYVRVGILVGGVFRHTPIASLELDDAHRLNFSLKTMVDVLVTSYKDYILEMAVWYKGDTLFVDFGGKSTVVQVPPIDTAERFSVVSDTIKSIVMFGAIDDRL